MPRVTPLIASFNAGEFSPRLVARTNFGKYPNAAARLENMLPWPQGGASRRPGTHFVAALKDEAKGARLLPFEFNITQAYVIEAGETCLRFYKDKGQIVALATQAAVTNGAFASDIAGWTDKSGAGSTIAWDATDKRMSLIGNGATEAHAEQRVTNSQAQQHALRFTVFGAAGDKVKLRIGTTTTGSEILADSEFAAGFHVFAFTTTSADFFVQFHHGLAKTLGIDDVALIDNAPIEVASPWTAAQLPEVQFAQTADIMYVVHPDVPPYKIARSGHSSWSVVEVDWSDGPWGTANTDTAKTFQPSATTGLGVTVTAAGHAPFAASDVGRLLRLESGTQSGWGVIVDHISGTQVKVDVRATFPLGGPFTQWRLGSWSRSSGFPACVTFYEQRLYAASTSSEPQTLWGTKSAAIEDFAPGTAAADDAVAFTIAADQVNVIEWLSPGNALAVGTAGGEWIVRASATNDPITPTNIQIKRNTTFGSSSRMAVRAGRSVLFVQRARRKLYAFSFDFQSDGFKAADLTILADHVGASGLDHIAWQPQPDSVLWCVRADGQLATLTFQPDQNVVGWSRQIVGGAFGGGAAMVESIAVIPGANVDQVWVVVKRTINGAVRRYVEVFEDAAFATQADAFHVDSGLVFTDERVSNGTFDTDIAGWTNKSTGAGAISWTPPGYLSLDGGGAGNTAHAEQSITTTAVNTEHVLSFTVITGPVTLRLGTSSGGQEMLADTAYMPGTHRVKFTPAASPVFIGFLHAANAGYLIDDVGLLRPTTAISGLDHLEGEAVSVLADGAFAGIFTVTGGAITLPEAAAKVTAGVAYKHRYKSLKFEGGAPNGTAIGRAKKVDGVTLVVEGVLGSKVGLDGGPLETLSYRKTSDPMDTAIPLFTGEKHVTIAGGYDSDPRLVVEGDAPFPFNILAVIPGVDTKNTAR